MHVSLSIYSESFTAINVTIYLTQKPCYKHSGLTTTPHCSKVINYTHTVWSTWVTKYVTQKHKRRLGAEMSKN